MVATILDPCLKLDYHRRFMWDDYWVNFCEEAIKTVYKEYKDTASIVDEPMMNEDDKPRDELYDELAEHLFGNLRHKRQATYDELDDYLKTDVLWTPEPLMWWCERETAYPILSKMARDFLAIPGTSAPVERVFSSAKSLIPANRSSLSPNTIRACMFEIYRLSQDVAKGSNND